MRPRFSLAEMRQRLLDRFGRAGRQPAAGRDTGRDASGHAPIDLGDGVQAIAGLPDSWDARLREWGLDPDAHRVMTWHCPLHVEPGDVVATFRIRAGEPQCRVLKRRDA